MASFDFSAEIRELRAVYASIAAVSDLEGIERAIAELSERAADPQLWDDPQVAQQVTSALSHKQAELNRLTSLGSRIDDVEVMVELAEAEDPQSAQELLSEARTECVSIRRKLEERAAFENRPVSFQMVIDDVYAIGKGFLVGRPRGTNSEQ